MAELFSGTLMSVALVILAGIALRYALWMGRERDADEGGAPALEERNRALAEALERAQANERDLRAENERISEDYQSLRRALEDRDAAIADSTSSSIDTDEMAAEFRRRLADLEAAKAETEAQHTAALSRLSDAEGRNLALHGQLDELRSKLRQQEDDRHALLVARDELQDSHTSTIEHRHQLAAERDSVAAERDQLVIERAELQRRRDELEETVEVISKQRSTVAQQRDELSQKIEAECAKAASAESLRVQSDELQAQLQSDVESANARFESALDECTKLQMALHQAEMKVAELTNRQLGESVEASQQLRAVESANRELTSELSEMESKVAEMESKVAETNEQLEQARQASARMQSDIRFVGQLRAERAKLMTQVEKLQQHVEVMRQSHATELENVSAESTSELEQLRKEMAVLREFVQDQAALEDQYQHNLEAKDQQLQDAISAQSRLEQEIEEVSKNLDRRDKIVGQFDDRMRNLHTEKEELTHGLQREQEVVRQLTAELESVQKQMKKMELELSHLELLRQDHQCVSEELSDFTTKANELSAERDALAEAMDSARRELMEMDSRTTRMEHELAAQNTLSSELRKDNESLQIELARLRTEKTTLEKLLQVHSETLQRLRSDSLSIETLLERQSAVQESLQQHADRLRSVALDVATESTATTDSGVESSGEHRARHDEAAEIRLFNEASSSSDAARIDSVLGFVYDRPPKNTDDLQRISGIGVVLEQKLNRLGIYRYKQLMNLTEEATSELSKLLAFKDRIDRDDWIGQSRRLYRAAGSRVA